MSMQDVIAALALPADSRVDQRVPKKLFLEQGAPTAADKRVIQEGIEDIFWVASLKPANIGVPAFKDEVREYVEIAVLSGTLRNDAKTARLIELIHRAIPYPVLLVTEQAGIVTVSLAHKRASQAQAAAVVIDGAMVAATLDNESKTLEAPFLAHLPLARQPGQSLWSLYQGWIGCVQALEAARLTGRYALTQTADEAAARQTALENHTRITREIAGLRAKAAKEKQINRRVDINLAIQGLEEELRAATNRL